MKYIRTFDSYKDVKKKLTSVDPEIFTQAMNESVLQVGDLYKVRSMVDIPQSLINSYIKKVKDTTGKNLRQFFGDVEIAEELLKFITISNLDVDKIPGNALMGGSQAQSQGTQVQVDVAQTTTDEVPAAQTTEAPAAQTTEAPAAQTTEVPVAQPTSDEFEEPAQSQGTQVQSQGTQVQTNQEQTPDENEEEENEEEENDKEELPL